MKKKYIVLQDEMSDCGVSCLLSIIRYYGGDSNIELLKLDSLTTDKGVSALNLIKCANKCGFDAKGVKVEKIKKVNLPCIAHVINKNTSHFIVICKDCNTYFEIMDPATGYKKISYNDFYNIFAGEIIELEVKGKIVEYRNSKTVEHQIKKELLDKKSKLILIIILNIVFILFSIMYSTNISIFLKYPYFICLLIFAFIVFIIYLFDLIIKISSLKISKNINKNLLRKFISNIFYLPLKYIHLKSSSEIIKRTEDLEVIKDLIKNCILSFVLNSIFIISISVILLTINIKLFLLVLFFIIIYPSIVLLLSKKLNKRVSNLIVDTNNYKNILNDMLIGIRSIIHSNSYKYSINIIDTSLSKYCDSSYNYDKSIIIINTINSICIALFELIINFYLVLLVKYNSLLIEDIIVINLLINLMISSLISIANGLPIITLIKKVLLKVNEYYDVLDNINESLCFSNGNIIFENINYKYNNYYSVLNNISFTINKGDKLMLRGPSGCGKSSICKILNKEITNYSGCIKINDIDLRDISSSSVRDNIIYLSQSETIFDDTIKNNIILGRIVSDNDLEKVLRVCAIDIIIAKKPFGLDSLLCGGGEELSGGERQLIILARMLLIHKDIIILDEALSMIPSKLEYKIVKNIFKEYSDSTIIYISHRDCKLFKKIISLDKKGVSYGIK